MKKIIMSFCVLYCMLGYNCIGLSGWLSDVTDAAVNKAKTTVNKDKSYEQERNKAIAEKITQILADIRKQLLAGNEIDIKSSFAASLSKICLSMPVPYNRLSKEEIDKYVVENQQNFDALLSERETLKQKALITQKEREIQQEKAQKEREIQQEVTQKEREIQQEPLRQKVWEKLLHDMGADREVFVRQYYHNLRETSPNDVSPEQLESELKKRLANIKFTNVNKFDSKINLYKDFSSGMSYAWVFLSCDSNEIGSSIFDNAFNVTFAGIKDGANQLTLLFSNGDGLLPITQFTQKDKEDGIVNDYFKAFTTSREESTGFQFNNEVFAAYIIFEKGTINIDEVLKKAEAKYNINFKITATQESIILSPLPYKTSFKYKTAFFENDNIKVEIQQLRYGGEKVEKIAKPSPDYDKWVSGLKMEARALEEILSGMYNITPSDKEIKEKIDGINSPVKMSIYDMKRLKKLYVLYQEELNALNVKRQAKEKEAKDKDAQAKKDALSF